MMFKRIDHVEIVTDQLDRTVQFYTEVLGFTVKARDRIERRVWVCPSIWPIWI
jgi:catechol 2,3-dioxygenase-like lactoylglutathione lyase family enzyme